MPESKPSQDEPSDGAPQTSTDARLANAVWAAETTDGSGSDRELGLASSLGAHDIASVWGLAPDEVAGLIQTASNQDQVADEVARITELLIRHLKRPRIPTVVRTPTASMGGQSLLDLVRAGSTARALELTRAMFLFGDNHG